MGKSRSPQSDRSLGQTGMQGLECHINGVNGEIRLSPEDHYHIQSIVYQIRAAQSERDRLILEFLYTSPIARPVIEKIAVLSQQQTDLINELCRKSGIAEKDFGLYGVDFENGKLVKADGI